MEEWLRQGGARFDAIAIEGADASRRVVATRPIGPQEEIIFIPAKRVISEEVVAKSTASKALMKAGVSQSEGHFAIFLCTEMQRGNGPWMAYIKALPPSFEYMPHFHAPQLAQLLAGTRAREIIQNDVQWARAAHQLAQRHVEALTHTPLDTFLHAYFAVRTRVFAVPVEGKRSAALVPLLDMCNHALTPNADWHYEPRKKSVSVLAKRPIEPGEEITVSYGDASNSTLFARYGFTLAGNPECEALLRLPGATPAHVRVHPKYADTRTAHVFAHLREGAHGSQNIDVRSEEKVVKELRTLALEQRQLIPTTPMNPGVHPLLDGASLVCADERSVLDWFIDLAQAALPVLAMPTAERTSAINAYMARRGPYSDYFATLAAAT